MKALSLAKLRRRPRLIDDLDTDWLRLVLIAWAGVVVWYLWQNYSRIEWLSLGDTDDNMRLMQVRAWMAGQGWFDLRNYRLNPPAGFDIHWSRIVDLPIAGLILLLRPFLGPVWAERWACGIAPLLPLSIVMLSLAFTVRRLVGRFAWPVALVLLMCCDGMLAMFRPERIDHHGWQLAMLAVTVAGLADRRQGRGGAAVGLASAVSLSIGLEMLPYCAMAGAILALRWVWDRGEARRLAVYGVTLAGGGAVGYAAFASYANSVLRCDALTPVWLSVLVVGGALLLGCALLSPATRPVRLVLAVAAGAVIAIGFALLFPQCLGRPEQISPELAKSWLDNVREAKPIYAHPFRVAFPLAILPVVGLFGAAIATRRALALGELERWAPVALFGLFAALMLLWQVRAAPAAEMLAVPGLTALVWIVLPWLWHAGIQARIAAGLLLVLIVGALAASDIIATFNINPPDRRHQMVSRANGRCPTLPALQPLDRYPAQTIFTFVDLGPRLVTVTHHDAIAGPYHRNGESILDVQHAFTGSPARFLAIARRHGATLLLVCPNMAESTVYRARAPQGFYGQLAHGKTWPWLDPLPLPRRSPLRLWRIDYARAAATPG